MGRVAIALLFAACSKHGDPPPPSPLQDSAAVVAPVADAAISIDAAEAREVVTAKQLVVANTRACAVMSDASVRCWEGNTATTPAIHGVTQLVLDDDLACGLIDDTSVMCWGNLGYGKHPGLATPTAVPGVRGVTRIFAIEGAACATDKAGALVCWGSVDARGHVIANSSHAPTPVAGVDHVVALSSHAAVRETGEVWTWIDSGAPTRTAVEHATELAEHDAPCVLADGVVTCFADKAPCVTDKPRKPSPRSKVKTKARKPEPSPAFVAFALPTAKTSHLAFAMGTCVQSAANRVDCVDLEHACKVVRPWPALVTVEQVSGACARLTNGTVRCGTSGSQAAPLIAGVANAISISATATRGCALTKDHAVLCWQGSGAAVPIAL